jgi:hypothetical protein
MARRERFKPDHRRTAIAQEAARIIQEQGLRDFRGAKEKAVERLGPSSRGRLPSNEEIDLALAERNRIFHGEYQPTLLRGLRRAALAIMDRLEAFQPRLVGPVLSGNATAHSPIDLHLFSDAAEAVSLSLQALRISHRPVLFHHRMRRGLSQAFPGYRFHAREFDYAVTVFPERLRRHAPLSPVDGKPMRRAGPRDIARLLGDG